MFYTCTKELGKLSKFLRPSVFPKWKNLELLFYMGYTLINHFLFGHGLVMYDICQCLQSWITLLLIFNSYSVIVQCIMFYAPR